MSERSTIVIGSKHTFFTSIAGVTLKVRIEGHDGDPALTRDFTDQLAQVVEEKLHEMTGPEGPRLVVPFRPPQWVEDEALGPSSAAS